MAVEWKAPPDECETLVLAGEDVSSTLSLFLLKLENLGFTAFCFQLNHNDVTVCNPRQHPLFYHDSCLSIY